MYENNCGGILFTHKKCQMKVYIGIILLLLGLSVKGQTYINRSNLFDFDWRFHLGGAQGADQSTFDDSAWRMLDLPHDWSIEDREGAGSPFNRDAIGQVSAGFTTGGTGWYRKSFIIPLDQKGKQFLIQFDGVYMNAEVWLNGKNLGSHPYGYTSFVFDISDKIRYSETNILAVKVRNEGENSRWYSGSGIYRHVWLKILPPVHVSNWGTAITTPEVTAFSATVNIKTNVENRSREKADIRLVTKIITSSGIESSNIASSYSVAAGANYEFDQNLKVTNPSLWSINTPNLYSAKTSVYTNGQLSDSIETHFGIRSISFDAIKGFLLNGVPLKLKGGCVHHDNGPLGSKAYDRAEERRVEILKANGYNAIRCAHNPPSPAFLDACDRLGMLVIDETFDMWKDGKNPFDYHLYFKDWWKSDVESMLLRDRNHPSVIMWSIGNEIPNVDSPEEVEVAKMLADYIRKVDPTRPVTLAANDVSPRKDALFEVLDICGYNYAMDKYASDHQRVPKRIMFCTESYPLESFEYWMKVLDNPFVIGDFVWTSFDYIGESSIGWRGYMQYQNFYPWNLAFCGDINICGWKRPQSYYRDALWQENQLSVFVKPPQPSFEVNADRIDWSKWHWFDVVSDWSWKGYENKPFEVSVFSSCEQVELFLNGKTLGKKHTNRNTKFMASWTVPYQAGTLKAIGYKGQNKMKVAELSSAGETTQIKLTADKTKIKADGQDLVYVTVELTDENQTINPKAENLIKFTVEGGGTIVGVGNANPVSIESYQQPQRKAWRGKCLVIVKSDRQAGSLKLTATGDGVKSASIEINKQ